MKSGFHRSILLWACCLNLLSACSWFTTFVVVNETDAPILITFKLPEPTTGKATSCSDGKSFPILRMLPKEAMEKLSRLNGEGEPITDLKCNATDGSLSFQLPAGYAASVFEISNHTGHMSEREFQKYKWLELPLISLSIRGQMGAVQYTGQQLTRDFMKTNNGLYVLSYQ